MVVRSVIRESRCDICCLQESKLNEINLSYVSWVLHSFFHVDVVSIDVMGSRGGCLIAWKKSYIFVSSWTTRHTTSIKLTQIATGQDIIVINVYGPSIEGKKLQFVEELRSLHALIMKPWLLIGDFNLHRWFADRSADLRGFPLMCAFNDLIRDLEIIDVPLQNRRFTWTSKRPCPSFSRINHMFITNHWNLAFPKIHLRALELIVSDHVPLLLTGRDNATRQVNHKFENFWLHFDQVGQVVQCIWQSQLPK